MSHAPVVFSRSCGGEGAGGGHWPAVGGVHGGRARAAQRARPFMPPQAPAAPPHGGGLGPPRWVLLPLRPAATGQGLSCCTPPGNTAPAAQGGLEGPPPTALPVGCSNGANCAANCQAPRLRWPPVCRCSAVLPCDAPVAARLAPLLPEWPLHRSAGPPGRALRPMPLRRPRPLPRPRPRGSLRLRARPFDTPTAPRTRLQVEVLGLCAGRASGDRESAPRPAPAPFAGCQGATPANRSWNRDHAARAAPRTHRRRTWH